MIKHLFAIICAVFISLCLAVPGFAEGEDSVLGMWWTSSKDAKIEIYKKDGTFSGKIVWTNDPEDLDFNNPDPAKRKNKLWGLDIIHGFKWDGKEWKDGKIYDPSNGKIYSCIMWMKGDNILFVKGYIGITLLGRKERWTRVKE